jgi:hypothetical protein
VGLVSRDDGWRMPLGLERRDPGWWQDAAGGVELCCLTVLSPSWEGWARHAEGDHRDRYRRLV